MNWWVGSGLSSDISIIICSDTGWRLDIELGERWVHRNGHCINWNVLPRFCCLCYEFSHLWLHPMQPQLHVNLTPTSPNMMKYTCLKLILMHDLSSHPRTQKRGSKNYLHQSQRGKPHVLCFQTCCKEIVDAQEFALNWRIYVYTQFQYIVRVANGRLENIFSLFDFPFKYSFLDLMFFHIKCVTSYEA